MYRKNGRCGLPHLCGSVAQSGQSVRLLSEMSRDRSPPGPPTQSKCEFKVIYAVD